MSGARTPAVPTGATALRRPTRPPIPGDDQAPDQTAAQRAGSPSAMPPGQRSAEAGGAAASEPGGEAPGKQGDVTPSEAGGQAGGVATVEKGRSTGDEAAGSLSSVAVGQATGQAASELASRSPRRTSGRRAGARGRQRPAAPAGEGPGGLRTRQTVLRTQLNTKMDVDLLDELREYAPAMGSTIQDVIEAAVRTFMDQYPADSR